jgi:hypothetical protein
LNSRMVPSCFNMDCGDGMLIHDHLIFESYATWWIQWRMEWHVVNLRTQSFSFSWITRQQRVDTIGAIRITDFFSLILHLRLLKMTASLHWHVVHVAGTRMIHKGTDGLSRGLLTDGIFSTDSMKLHIPLHVSAFEQQPSLLEWIQSWCPDASIQPLTPAG